MNTTYEQSASHIVLETPKVSEATSDQGVRPSKETPPTSLPHALKPQKKITKKKKKS